MHNFLEEQFPTDISFGSIGGPMYQTSIIENQFGMEVRSIAFQEPKHIYNIEYGIRNEKQIQKLTSFFHNCMGRSIAFRFKDWNDYKVENQCIAVADGETKEFAIYKEYTVRSKTFRRRIHKPVKGTVQIKQFEGYSAGVCNYQTGIIAFATPPKAGILIILSLEFDTPVRFDTDFLPIKITNKNLREVEPIKLVEVKL